MQPLRATALALVLATTSATAGDIQRRVDLAPDGPSRPARVAPVYFAGVLGVEYQLATLGRPLRDVVLLRTRLEGVVEAPAAAVSNGRKRRWNQVLGNARLTVVRVRASDGAVLAQGTTSSGSARRSLCVETSQPDTRPIEIHTYTEGDRAEHYPVYYVEAPDRRLALVPLQPGESITHYLALDAPPGEGIQQLRIHRLDGTVQITERSGVQEVCVEP